MDVYDEIPSAKTFSTRHKYIIFGIASVIVLQIALIVCLMSFLWPLQKLDVKKIKSDIDKIENFVNFANETLHSVKVFIWDVEEFIKEIEKKLHINTRQTCDTMDVSTCTMD